MQSETILLVDDNQEIQELLCDFILKPDGYAVVTASDGRQGLEMMVRHAPDLIMLDNNMPRMSGLEMLKALREGQSDTPVIFMTVYGSEQTAVEAFRLGVRDYLSKPFTPEDARQAIDRALMASRLSREKETLSRNLIASETIRKTVTTLAHHINNQLMAISGGLTLLEESMQMEHQPIHNHVRKILKNSQDSVHTIEAVLRILQHVADIEPETYHCEMPMLNIEDALAKELERFQEQQALDKLQKGL